MKKRIAIKEFLLAVLKPKNIANQLNVSLSLVYKWKNRSLETPRKKKKQNWKRFI
jgi:transposase